MDDNGSESSLSFFTSNHPRHDSSWIFRGSSVSIVCVACLIETLEERETLAIRKRKSLTEIILLLSRDEKLVEILKKNVRITSHLCQILVNLLESTQVGVFQISLEGLVQIAFKVQSDVLIREILDTVESKILSINNYRKTYPFVVLMGKIVDAIPLLGEEVVAQKPKLWKYCTKGLSFPDETVVVALLYLILSIYKSPKAKERTTVEIKSDVFKKCCENLINGKNNDVKINSLALLQCYASSEGIQSVKLLSEDKEGTDARTMLGNALKKLVLSTDQGLQVGGIQITTKLLSIDTQEKVLSSAFLRCGLAEFLFEALETNNDIVLASLFCCLTELCNCAEFFTGSYSIYGIDSVVSAIIKAVNLQNPETLQQGLHVLSTIISRQKKEVPLFNNGTIFDRCLKITEECLKAMEYKVLQEALQLVRSLLRADQLPSGYDVTRLLSSLNGVVAVLKRFTSKTVESFSGMQSGTAQELLCQLLEVIYQAVIFTNNYSRKSPSLEEVLLTDLLPATQSSNTQSSSQAFNDFVMKAIDETCITAVMVNYEAISNAAVFEILFKLLNSQLQDNNKDKTTTFAKKLSVASFIRISMEISGRFCKDGSNLPLMIELKCFQKSLITNLNKEYLESEQLMGILELAAIPGSAEEYLTLLSQACLDPISMDISDQMLFKIQCYCIELLYLAYSYQDFILSDMELIRGIHNFICLNRNLVVLPVLTLKHLLHLYTDITMKHQCETLNGLIESEKILEQQLLKFNLEEFQAVSCNTTTFVQWVFRSETLCKSVGKYLLNNVLSTNKECIELGLWKTFVDSKTAVRDLLSLIVSEDKVMVNKVCKTIERILTENATTQENKQVAFQVIEEELQRLFLMNKGTVLPDHVLTAMLQILLSLQVSKGVDVDMKIFYLVVDVLTKAAYTTPNITIAGVNYLNIALWTNMRSGRPNIAAMLLSNKVFILWLQKVLTAMKFPSFGVDNSTVLNVFGVCMILLSNLIISQSKFEIKTTYSVTLDKVCFLGLLNDYHNCILRLPSLVFWGRFLDINTETFAIFSKEQGADEEESALTETDYKVMLVYLQNALMHESKSIRNCAMRCLKVFLSCTQRRNHCSSNPWNKVILESFRFSLTQGNLESDLLNFCIIMMKAKSFWNMEEPLATTAAVIMEQIPNISVHLDEQGHLSPVAEHCICFLQHLVTCDLPLAKSLTTDRLLSWLKRAHELGNQSKQLRSLCFIKVDQVVLPEEIVTDQLLVPDVKAVSEILRKLKG